MKKNNYAGLAVLLASMPFGLLAQDGTINFEGTISNTACTVDSISADMTVDLGTVSTSAFSAPGDVASPTKFNIIIKNCPESVNSAAVSFTGEADATNPSLFKLSGDGAEGIGIALYEGDSTTQVAANMSSSDYNIDSSKTENTLSFISKYMSTQQTVNAGLAASSVSFSIAYK